MFVGGLDASVNETNLRGARIGRRPGVREDSAREGCGFVQFEERRCAEAAISKLNGAVVGTSRLRLSWVRSHARGAGPAGMTGMTGLGMGAVPPGVHPGMIAAAAAANAGAYGAYGGSYHPAVGYLAHAHAVPGFRGVPGQWQQQTPPGVDFDQAYVAHYAAQAQAHQYAAAVAAAGAQQQHAQHTPHPFGLGRANPQAPPTPSSNAAESSRAHAASGGESSGDGSPVAGESVANGRTGAGRARRRAT